MLGSQSDYSSPLAATLGQILRLFSALGSIRRTFATRPSVADARGPSVPERSPPRVSLDPALSLCPLTGLAVYHFRPPAHP